MSRIDKILVPIDFGDSARPVVAMAIDLAKKVDATIDFFHVWQPPAMLPMQLLVVQAANEGAPMPAEEVARSVAASQLKEFVAQARSAGVKEPHCRVGVGSPAHDIVELARVGPFDLIVMGTHGRRGMAHAFLGSVAERVVRTASCPVLTVRMRE